MHACISAQIKYFQSRHFKKFQFRTQGKKILLESRHLCQSDLNSLLHFDMETFLILKQPDFTVSNTTFL